MSTSSTLYVDHRGDGPAVLLIAGLGDPAEAWQLQLEAFADRYHVIAFDNRGVGRSPLPDGPLSVEGMADDAAAVLAGLDIAAAHVVGFSGGSIIAQELALRHPDRVVSLVLNSTWAQPDRYLTAMVESWRWMAEHAPDARSFLQAFYAWIYTARAHENGLVDQLIADALDFPHPQSLESLHRQIDAFASHQTIDRLARIAAPTLVIAGGQDIACPPRLGRIVADAIPGAQFHVMPDEAHQPFQEVPEQFNELVERFWLSRSSP
jgi:pimeloyl-ACP methyl ester carboxylesterase